MRVDVLVVFAHLLRATRPHHGGVLRRAAAAPTGLRAVALGLRTAAGSGRGRRPAALLPPPCHTHRAVTARQTLQAWPQMRAAVGIRQGMGVWMERVVAWGWPRSGTWSPLMDMALLPRSHVTPGIALPAWPCNHVLYHSIIRLLALQLLAQDLVYDGDKSVCNWRFQLLSAMFACAARLPLDGLLRQ